MNENIWKFWEDKNRTTRETNTGRFARLLVRVRMDQDQSIGTLSVYLDDGHYDQRQQA